MFSGRLKSLKFEMRTKENKLIEKGEILQEKYETKADIKKQLLKSIKPKFRKKTKIKFI